MYSDSGEPEDIEANHQSEPSAIDVVWWKALLREQATKLRGRVSERSLRRF